MTKTKISLSIILLLLIVSCGTRNPFTGKKVLNMYKNEQIFPMSFQQYNQFLTQTKVITGTAQSDKIKKIGTKISVAAERYLDALNQPGYLADYRWEYNLVDDKAVNAFCMPGGKIVFFTGILPIAKNDAGIAAIMGHEVAHALANHGAQRMSAAQLQQIGAVATGIAVGGQNQQTQEMVMQAYGMGSQIGGMLPFSRNHETEADKIGIILMAIAGYDPEEAPLLWKRMKENSNGEAPPEILSTHPSNDSRIQVLTSMIPQAKTEAKKFGVTTFKR